MNILWVEDSFDAVSEIASVLNRMGHKIILAGSRAAAIKIIEGGWRGDFIILDSMMPEEDRHPTHSGCDLFRELRAGRWGDWGRTIQTTFITAYEDNVTEKIADVRPEPLILPKPIESTEAVENMARAFPNIVIKIEAGSRAAVTINGTATFNETTHASPVLTPGDMKQIMDLAREMLKESTDGGAEASQLLLGIANAKEDGEKQQKAVQTFREWLSNAGDQVKEGIRTSAAIVAVATPVLKVLGIL
jgi:CheY-like chemotaxis protein